MLDIESLAAKAFQTAKLKTTKVLGDIFPNLGVSNFPEVSTSIESIASKSMQAAANFGVPMLNGMDGINYGYDWAGLAKEQISAHYKDLAALGVQRKQHYVVKFTPYKNNLTRYLPIMDSELIGWLATDVSVPLLQLETESKKVGNHTINYVTGRSASEFTIGMIETKNLHVIRSLDGLENIVCRRDGTQYPPAAYAMWVDIILYDRDHGVNDPKVSKRILCYPSQANLDLNAAEDGALVIPITLTPCRGFMSM